MILTRAQIAAFEKAIATANQILPRIEFLAALARLNPQIQQRVDELRAKRDYLYAISEAALEFERQMNYPQTGGAR